MNNKPESNPNDVAASLSYNDVLLTDSVLKSKLRTIGEYYLSIPTADVFFEMRKHAGLDTGAGKSIVRGRSWFGVGGIVLGQWMQAFARFFRATQDERYRQRCAEYVGQLQEVSAVSPDCYICRTAYQAEKIFHGLMDAAEYCGIEDAFSLCGRLLDHFRSIPAIRRAKCRIGDNGGSKDETSCEIEWYTLSEALYRFADMAGRRGAKRDYVEELLRFARKFEYEAYWKIFAGGENMFDYSPVAGQNTAYFHAYSHLNSFNSAMYLYRKTGEKRYLESAERFMRFIRDTQTLVTGGYGALNEWLMPTTGIIYALRNNHTNFENQCNSYACFRLNNALTVATGKLEYGDLTELLYYNSFLASPETDKDGHVYYYADYCVDGGKKCLHPISWTCCSGTRPLAALEVLRNIYFTGKDGEILVNLYIGSSYCGRCATIEQRGEYPVGDMTFRIIPHAGHRGERQVVRLRKPAWLAGAAEFTGADASEEADAYTVELTLDKEREFSVRFPMRVDALDIRSCGEGVRAFRYGPLALAAEGENLGKEAPAAADFKRTGAAEFTAEGLTFRSFAAYELDEAYTMYFNIGEEQR